MKVTESKLTVDQMLLALIADNTRALAWLNSADGAKGINRPRSLVEILTNGTKMRESGVKVFESSQAFDDEWRRLTGGES